MKKKLALWHKYPMMMIMMRDLYDPENDDKPLPMAERYGAAVPVDLQNDPKDTSHGSRLSLLHLMIPRLSNCLLCLMCY